METLLSRANEIKQDKRRQTLIDKGLIYSPDHGQVDFTVPYFGDFMRRKHPLESLTS